MTTRTWIALTGLLLLPYAGCGDDSEPDEHEEHEHDPAEHACEHASEEGTEVAGGAERDESAPRLELGEEPYTIALDETEPRWVRLEVEDHTTAILLTNAEDVVTGLYHEDEEESLDSAGANTYCEEEIPEHFDLDLHEAGTYYLRLGPSALADAWIVIMEAEGHAH